MAIHRAAPGTLPTTPEQWEEIRTKTRKTILDQLNPILAALAQQHEVISVSTLVFDNRSGRFILKFPELNTGGIECEILFDLGVKRTGSRYAQEGYVFTGSVLYKTMTGPDSRYFAGNWKRWDTDKLRDIWNYLDDFFRVAKLRHKQRTAAQTRKPRVEEALRRVALGATEVEIIVNTDIGGLFQTIERRLTLQGERVREVYLYDYDQECLVLNRKEINYTQPVYVRL